MIAPSTISIPQQVLDDLKLKIKLTRWPEGLAGEGWEYGSGRAYMNELALYWQDTFDWRKTEAAINSFPNFMADINGYQIHFLHIKGKGKHPCRCCLPGMNRQVEMNFYVFCK
ncbi:MAG: epoxide hydrolase N-terminal domain-containing protein [Mucilaginibacter sp.]|nr:epoxide hydrolase N-terminal domain-containing protein [Mucilaginibacter sp.]